MTAEQLRELLWELRKQRKVLETIHYILEEIFDRLEAKEAKEAE